jgi:hypothetical protein
MEFFIKQNSNLPILKMDVVRDGRTDSWKDFYSVLDNATIRFSMKSENDGIQKIFMRPAYITEKERRNPDSPREYYIYYKWRGKDTNKKGRFIGEFLIELSNGELIGPIRENLIYQYHLTRVGFTLIFKTKVNVTHV